MTETIKSDKELNLQGLLCPLPVVKISKAITEVPVGGVLEATATDPGVMADIPAWSKSTGHEVVKMQKEGKIIRFWVKRLK
jgi:tRNA 2-thiouridine synthesizing protein A